MRKFGIDQERFYRHWARGDSLSRFHVAVKETDLYISACKGLYEEALNSVEIHRRQLEDYIQNHTEFAITLEPYPLSDDMPAIVREMTEAAKLVGVGPMAAVAGAIAERVGGDLLKFSDEVIVENGGDIFLKVNRPIKVGIYAADSPFTGKLAVNIEPDNTPLGICTSSGTVGPSLSFGTSDATVVISRSAAIADAYATSIGNLIKSEHDIPCGIEVAKRARDIKGVLIIKGKKIGMWGDIAIDL